MTKITAYVLALAAATSYVSAAPISKKRFTASSFTPKVANPDCLQDVDSPFLPDGAASSVASISSSAAPAPSLVDVQARAPRRMTFDSFIASESGGCDLPTQEDEEDDTPVEEDNVNGTAVFKRFFNYFPFLGEVHHDIPVIPQTPSSVVSEAAPSSSSEAIVPRKFNALDFINKGIALRPSPSVEEGDGTFNIQTTNPVPTTTTTSSAVSASASSSGFVAVVDVKKRAVFNPADPWIPPEANAAAATVTAATVPDYLILPADGLV